MKISDNNFQPSMLYRLTLSCHHTSQIVKPSYYYSILGAFLGLLEETQVVYDQLVKLDYYYRSQKLVIGVVVTGAEAFNTLISSLTKRGEISLSIDGDRFILQQIRLDHRIWDPQHAGIGTAPGNFILHFLSPTFVRQQNTLFLLPVPEQFFGSAANKLETLFPGSLGDIAVCCRALERLYVGEYKLYTEQLMIKKALKSGVKGYMKIYTKHIPDERKLFLVRLLHALPFIGMGSGTRLGLGNVQVKYSEEKKKN